MHQRQKKSVRLISHRDRPFRQALRRIVSLIACFSLLIPFVAWSFQPRNLLTKPIILAPNLQPIQLPSSLGTIADQYQGGDKLVIHVQDLHCHYEVQMTIARIIDHFARELNLQLVGVEGAHQTLRPEQLRLFPIKDIRQEVADYFVRQGKLTGAEYYAITGEKPVTLEGIETGQLYHSNLQTAQAILSDEALGYVYDIKDSLHALKHQIYQQPLYQVDKKRTGFHNGKISLDTYLAFIIKQANLHRIDVNRFHAIKDYLRLAGHQPTRLDLEQVLIQAETLDKRLRQHYYQHNDERELDRLCNNWMVVEKLLNLSATAQDLQAYLVQPGNYSITHVSGFIQRHQPDWTPEVDYFQVDHYLELAKDFYRVADQRSLAFVTNIKEKMDKQQTSVALMITGGYHAKHVLEALKQQHISYLSIKPSLTQHDLINPYFSLLKNKQSPLEKLLAQEQKELALASYLPQGPDRGLFAHLEKWGDKQRLFYKMVELFLKIKIKLLRHDRMQSAQQLVDKLTQYYGQLGLADQQPANWVDTARVVSYGGGILTFPANLASDPQALVVVWPASTTLALQQQELRHHSRMGKENVAVIAGHQVEQARQTLALYHQLGDAKSVQLNWKLIALSAGVLASAFLLGVVYEHSLTLAFISTVPGEPADMVNHLPWGLAAVAMVALPHAIPMQPDAATRSPVDREQINLLLSSWETSGFIADASELRGTIAALLATGKRQEALMVALEAVTAVDGKNQRRALFTDKQKVVLADKGWPVILSKARIWPMLASWQVVWGRPTYQETQQGYLNPATITNLINLVDPEELASYLALFRKYKLNGDVAVNAIQNGRSLAQLKALLQVLIGEQPAANRWSRTVVAKFIQSDISAGELAAYGTAKIPSNPQAGELAKHLNRIATARPEYVYQHLTQHGVAFHDTDRLKIELATTSDNKAAVKRHVLKIVSQISLAGQDWFPHALIKDISDKWVLMRLDHIVAVYHLCATIKLTQATLIEHALRSHQQIEFIKEILINTDYLAQDLQKSILTSTWPEAKIRAFLKDMKAMGISDTTQAGLLRQRVEADSDHHAARVLKIWEKIKPATNKKSIFNRALEQKITVKDLLSWLRNEHYWTLDLDLDEGQLMVQMMIDEMMTADTKRELADLFQQLASSKGLLPDGYKVGQLDRAYIDFRYWLRGIQPSLLAMIGQSVQPGAWSDISKNLAITQQIERERFKHIRQNYFSLDETDRAEYWQTNPDQWQATWQQLGVLQFTLDTKLQHEVEDLMIRWAWPYVPTKRRQTLGFGEELTAILRQYNIYQPILDQNRMVTFSAYVSEVLPKRVNPAYQEATTGADGDNDWRKIERVARETDPNGQLALDELENRLLAQGFTPKTIAVFLKNWAAWWGQKNTASLSDDDTDSVTEETPLDILVAYQTVFDFLKKHQSTIVGMLVGLPVIGTLFLVSMISTENLMWSGASFLGFLPDAEAPLSAVMAAVQSAILLIGMVATGKKVGATNKLHHEVNRVLNRLKTLGWLDEEQIKTINEHCRRLAVSEQPSVALQMMIPAFRRTYQGKDYYLFTEPAQATVLKAGWDNFVEQFWLWEMIAPATVRFVDKSDSQAAWEPRLSDAAGQEPFYFSGETIKTIIANKKINIQNWPDYVQLFTDHHILAQAQIIKSKHSVAELGELYSHFAEKRPTPAVMGIIIDSGLSVEEILTHQHLLPAENRSQAKEVIKKIIRERPKRLLAILAGAQIPVRAQAALHQLADMVADPIVDQQTLRAGLADLDLADQDRSLLMAAVERALSARCRFSQLIDLLDSLPVQQPAKVKKLIEGLVPQFPFIVEKTVAQAVASGNGDNAEQWLVNLTNQESPNAACRLILSSIEFQERLWLSKLRNHQMFLRMGALRVMNRIRAVIELYRFVQNKQQDVAIVIKHSILFGQRSARETKTILKRIGHFSDQYVQTLLLNSLPLSEVVLLEKEMVHQELSGRAQGLLINYVNRHQNMRSVIFLVKGLNQDDAGRTKGALVQRACQQQLTLDDMKYLLINLQHQEIQLAYRQVRLMVEAFMDQERLIAARERIIPSYQDSGETGKTAAGLHRLSDDHASFLVKAITSPPADKLKQYQDAAQKKRAQLRIGVESEGGTGRAMEGQALPAQPAELAMVEHAEPILSYAYLDKLIQTLVEQDWVPRESKQLQQIITRMGQPLDHQVVLQAILENMVKIKGAKVYRLFNDEQIKQIASAGYQNFMEKSWLFTKLTGQQVQYSKLPMNNPFYVNGAVIRSVMLSDTVTPENFMACYQRLSNSSFPGRQAAALFRSKLSFNEFAESLTRGVQQHWRPEHMVMILTSDLTADEITTHLNELNKDNEITLAAEIRRIIALRPLKLLNQLTAAKLPMDNQEFLQETVEKLIAEAANGQHEQLANYVNQSFFDQHPALYQLPIELRNKLILDAAVNEVAFKITQAILYNDQFYLRGMESQIGTLSAKRLLKRAPAIISLHRWETTENQSLAVSLRGELIFSRQAPDTMITWMDQGIRYKKRLITAQVNNPLPPAEIDQLTKLMVSSGFSNSQQAAIINQVTKQWDWYRAINLLHMLRYIAEPADRYRMISTALKYQLSIIDFITMLRAVSDHRQLNADMVTRWQDMTMSYRHRNEQVRQAQAIIRQIKKTEHLAHFFLRNQPPFMNLLASVLDDKAMATVRAAPPSWQEIYLVAFLTGHLTSPDLARGGALLADDYQLLDELELPWAIRVLQARLLGQLEAKQLGRIRILTPSLCQQLDHAVPVVWQRDMVAAIINEQIDQEELVRQKAKSELWSVLAACPAHLQLPLLNVVLMDQVQNKIYQKLPQLYRDYQDVLTDLSESLAATLMIGLAQNKYNRRDLRLRLDQLTHHLDLITSLPKKWTNELFSALLTNKLSPYALMIVNDLYHHPPLSLNKLGNLSSLLTIARHQERLDRITDSTPLTAQHINELIASAPDWIQQHLSVAATEGAITPDQLKRIPRFPDFLLQRWAHNSEDQRTARYFSALKGEWRLEDLIDELTSGQAITAPKLQDLIHTTMLWPARQQARQELIQCWQKPAATPTSTWWPDYIKLGAITRFHLFSYLLGYEKLEVSDRIKRITTDLEAWGWIDGDEVRNKYARDDQLNEEVAVIYLAYQLQTAAKQKLTETLAFNRLIRSGFELFFEYRLLWKTIRESEWRLGISVPPDVLTQLYVAAMGAPATRSVPLIGRLLSAESVRTIPQLLSQQLTAQGYEPRRVGKQSGGAADWRETQQLSTGSTPTKQASVAAFDRPDKDQTIQELAIYQDGLKETLAEKAAVMTWLGLQVGKAEQKVQTIYEQGWIRIVAYDARAQIVGVVVLEKNSQVSLVQVDSKFKETNIKQALLTASLAALIGNGQDTIFMDVAVSKPMVDQKFIIALNKQDNITVKLGNNQLSISMKGAAKDLIILMFKKLPFRNDLKEANVDAKPPTKPQLGQWPFLLSFYQHWEKLVTGLLPEKVTPYLSGLLAPVMTEGLALYLLMWGTGMSGQLALLIWFALHLEVEKNTFSHWKQAGQSVRALLQQQNLLIIYGLTAAMLVALALALPVLAHSPELVVSVFSVVHLVNNYLQVRAGQVASQSSPSLAEPGRRLAGASWQQTGKVLVSRLILSHRPNARQNSWLMVVDTTIIKQLRINLMQPVFWGFVLMFGSLGRTSQQRTISDVDLLRWQAPQGFIRFSLDQTIFRPQFKPLETMDGNAVSRMWRFLRGRAWTVDPATDELTVYLPKTLLMINQFQNRDNMVEQLLGLALAHQMKGAVSASRVQAGYALRHPRVVRNLLVAPELVGYYQRNDQARQRLMSTLAQIGQLTMKKNSNYFWCKMLLVEMKAVSVSGPYQPETDYALLKALSQVAGPKVNVIITKPNQSSLELKLPKIIFSHPQLRYLFRQTYRTFNLQDEITIEMKWKRTWDHAA